MMVVTIHPSVTANIFSGWVSRREGRMGDRRAEEERRGRERKVGRKERRRKRCNEGTRRRADGRGKE
jgi:hypothetical protein